MKSLRVEDLAEVKEERTGMETSIPSSMWHGAHLLRKFMYFPPPIERTKEKEDGVC
jgi:hypothetical protein